MTLYIIKLRPSTVLQDNYIELYNELTILSVFTLIVPYVHDTGFSVERKYDHGFTVSSIIFLNVLVNFVLFARNTYLQLKVKVGGKVVELKDKIMSKFTKS